ncbi:MAG: sugar phosphate isomerase/epimerase [Candidatus Bathyarchaeota archaeon]|nr:sugar phosphate isomerase/epimerase [Candidatus Bathyarchaeota archaeon]
MDTPIAISTTAFDGYPLKVALEEISRLGYQYVELAAISGVIEHIRGGDFNSEYLKNLRTLMSQYNLSSVAFSGHLDLTQADVVALFKKRMHFAKKLGARIINTNAGPPERIDAFYRNIVPIARYAEEIGLTVAVESHGDIINEASRSAKVIERIGSAWVRINYDFANVLFFSGGRIKPEDDFSHCIEYCSHLHLKDVVLKNNLWQFCAIGKGMIDYAKIFRLIAKYKLRLPMSLELPLRLTAKRGQSLKKLKHVPSIEKINKIILDSMTYVRTLMESNKD